MPVARSCAGNVAHRAVGMVGMWPWRSRVPPTPVPHKTGGKLEAPSPHPAAIAPVLAQAAAVHTELQCQMPITRPSGWVWRACAIQLNHKIDADASRGRRRTLSGGEPRSRLTLRLLQACCG